MGIRIWALIGHWSLGIGVLTAPICLLLLFRPASADISSCSASVAPSSLDPNVTAVLTFNVQNTDINDIRWVRISVPSGQYNLMNASASGWSRSLDGSSVTFSGGAVSAGSSANFSVTVQTGVYPSSAETWPVSASDDSGGAAAADCTGDTSISVGGDVEGPVLSSVRAINVTTTGATISWTTNESATSKVRYGGGTAYGTTVSGGTLTTAHEMNLSGLQPGTTYHYQVESADATGNTSTSSDKIFTTVSVSASPSPSAQISPSPTSGVPDGDSEDEEDNGGSSDSASSTQERQEATETSSAPTRDSTKRSTASPSPVVPTIPIDGIPPTVLIRTSLEKPFAEAPSLSGFATDNIGVQSVYYSVDGGKNWLPIKSLRVAGEKQLSFSFSPNLTEDDDYAVKLRAVDVNGNIGVSREYRLVIDTMPPVMGPAVYFSGSQILDFNDESEAQIMLINVGQKVAVSAIGGPINIDVVARKSETQEEFVFPMKKNMDNGWWIGSVSFSAVGTYDASFQAQDGAGNETTRIIRKIRVVEGGAVYHQGSAVLEANVEVWQKDEVTGRFRPWQAEAYGQKNPQLTNTDGAFGYILPKGSYYISISKEGLRPAKTQIFTLNRSATIHPRINLTTLSYVSLGIIEVPYPPVFWPEVLAVNIREKRPDIAIAGKEELSVAIPDEALVHSMDGSLNVSDWRQEKIIVSFMAPWSPQTSEQISQMDGLSKEHKDRVVPVLLQSSPESATLLRKKGGYDVNIWADPIGLLGNALEADSLIFHALVDADGKIIEKKHGVMSIGQMEEMLE